MAKKTKVVRGKRMVRGAGWDIAATKGKKRSFTGTLLGTHFIGGKRIAVFSVPSRFK